MDNDCVKQHLANDVPSYFKEQSKIAIDDGANIAILSENIKMLNQHIKEEGETMRIATMAVIGCGAFLLLALAGFACCLNERKKYQELLLEHKRSQSLLGYHTKIAAE